MRQAVSTTGCIIVLADGGSEMAKTATVVTQGASVLCAFCRGTNLFGAMSDVWQIYIRNYR